MSLDTPVVLLSMPSEVADDLIATNAPDLLTNEQTWPTDEEMASGNGGAVGSERRVKRVPKGTSAYQAAWIFDDEAGDGMADSDGDGDEVRIRDMQNQNRTDEHADEFGHPSLVNEEAEETEEIELDSRRGATHRDLDPEQEEKEWVVLAVSVLTRSGIQITCVRGKERSVTIFSSQTKLTHLDTSLRVPGFNGIAVSRVSGRARGTHTRIFRWTMREYSNSKTFLRLVGVSSVTGRTTASR